MQTSKALIIGFDTPAVIQTSCEPLENLVATRAAQQSMHRTAGTLRVFWAFSSPAAGNASRWSDRKVDGERGFVAARSIVAVLGGG